MGSSARAPVLALAVVLAGPVGCGSPAPDEEIPVGLLLSYSGPLAANSINSERALRLAIESANAAGGVAGRRLRVLARDTRSDPAKVSQPALELMSAGATIMIGPDTTDLVNQLRTLLGDRAVLLPSFGTSSINFKPETWFVMGAAPARVACELVAQLRADGRQNPLVIHEAKGYSSLLSWELTNRYSMPRYVLASEGASTAATVRPITAAGADAYLLAALPPSASSLIYALAAIGALDDPGRWYLSPTLHTPAFLESIPKGALAGARGVSPGTVAGAADFRASFNRRWHDEPLDDAYAFYDAGAVAVLALQRAVNRAGVVLEGHALVEHILGVTRAGGTPILWNELARGLTLLTQGQEVEYVGVSGATAFDISGQTSAAHTKWWVVEQGRFSDVPADSDCR